MTQKLRDRPERGTSAYSGTPTPMMRFMRLACTAVGCSRDEIHISVRTRQARMLCRRCGRFSPVSRW
ncbi:MAG: hypothetical protein AB7F35_26450 [Acetobacteraceae bacterium]